MTNSHLDILHSQAQALNLEIKHGNELPAAVLATGFLSEVTAHPEVLTADLFPAFRAAVYAVATVYSQQTVMTGRARFAETTSSTLPDLNQFSAEFFAQQAGLGPTIPLAVVELATQIQLPAGIRTDGSQLFRPIIDTITTGISRK